jgi:RNA polymerase sigma-70 factor, ECF subfamily
MDVVYGGACVSTLPYPMLRDRGWLVRLVFPVPARLSFDGDHNPSAAKAMASGGTLRPLQRQAAPQKPGYREPSPAADLAALLEQCADGDRTAFRRLYDLQSSRLYAVALRITRQPTLAADAVHDAFLQVWQNAGRFDVSRGNPEAWLVSLVRYRALDIARRNAREVPGLEPPDAPDEQPGALDRMIGTAEGEALHRCLQALPPDRRRLVVMAFIDGLTHSELSVRLGQPLGTIKSWIRRALITLKQCLEP